MKLFNLIMITGLNLALVLPVAMHPLTVEATTIKEIQDKIVNSQHQIADTQDEINEINDQIDRLTDEQDIVQEKIDDLNAEIINTMTSIGMKEDEIAVKEDEIAVKEDEITAKEVELADKVVEIDAAQVEYEAAKAREEEQYAGMTSRTKLMYENSDISYLGLLLQGVGLREALNQMDFIKKVHEYDRLKLEEYENTKNEVHDLWDFLETEKAQLETDKSQLETDKSYLEMDKVQLETDKEALQAQKENLNVMLAQKKAESNNYDEEIAEAKREAIKAKAALLKEKKHLEQLREEQSKVQAAEAAAAAAAQAAAEAAAAANAAVNGNYTETSYTEIIEKANGSELGKKIAKYACQYIGNPYVYGGTSLTNGADCSGFVYRVYSDFGYKLPRTSFEQRGMGTEVDYTVAQPGDLVCYDGHIGIYIGSGKIVHASTKKTGIKVSNATYRPILSVRRIIN